MFRVFFKQARTRGLLTRRFLSSSGFFKNIKEKSTTQSLVPSINNSHSAQSESKPAMKEIIQAPPQRPYTKQIPMYLINEVQKTYNRPSQLRDAEVKEELFTEEEIEAQFIQKYQGTRILSDSHLVWQLLQQREDKSSTLNSIQQAINSESNLEKFSPQELFQAFIEVSSYSSSSETKIENLKRQGIIDSRASQLYQKKQIDITIQAALYFLTQVQGSKIEEEQKRGIILPLLLKGSINFNGSISENIETMRLLLISDQNERHLQVAQFSQFLSSLLDDLKSNKSFSSQNLQKFINILQTMNQRYKVTLFYNEAYIDGLSSQLARSCQNLSLSNQYLVKLLDFYYRYNERFSQEFEQEFFTKRLLDSGSLMKRFDSQQLLRLVKCLYNRVNFKSKSFQYMDYTHHTDDLSRTSKADSIKQFYCRLVDEFKNTAEKLEVVLEIFKSHPQFFKIYLTSQEELESLRQLIISKFHPQSGNFQGFFNMLRLFASRPLSANQAQKIKEVVSVFLNRDKTYNSRAQITNELAQRVALFQASQYIPELQNTISSNKRMAEQLKKSKTLSKLEDALGFGKYNKNLFKVGDDYQEKEEFDLFLSQNSSNLVRYVSYLQSMNVHLSEEILKLIEPKALISDAIDKFCKLQLRFGRLNPQSIALLVSNLKTLERKMMGQGIEFNFDSSQKFKEEISRRVKEDFHIVLKSILQVYKKNPELKSTYFSSPSFGWLVHKVFEELSEEDKILSLDVLGKNKLENYMPEFLQQLSQHYSAELIKSFLKSDKSKLLLALVEVWPSFIPNTALILSTSHLTELKIPTDQYIPLLDSLAGMNVIHQEFIENTLSMILGIRNNEQRTRQLEQFLENISNLGYGVQNVSKLLAGIINTYQQPHLVPQKVLTNFFLVLLYRIKEEDFLELSKLEDRASAMIRHTVNEPHAPYTTKQLLEFVDQMYYFMYDELTSSKFLQVENYQSQGLDQLEYYECIESEEATFNKVLQENSLAKLLQKREQEPRMEEGEDEGEDDTRGAEADQESKFYNPRAFEKEQNLLMRNHRDLRSKLMARHVKSNQLFSNLRRTTSNEEIITSHQLKTLYLMNAIQRSIKYNSTIKEGQEYDKKLQQLRNIENPWINEFVSAMNDELKALRFNLKWRRYFFQRGLKASIPNFSLDGQKNIAILFKFQANKVHVFKPKGKLTYSITGLAKIQELIGRREFGDDVIVIDEQVIEKRRDFQSWEKEGAATAHQIQERINQMHGIFEEREDATDRNVWF